MKPNAAHEQLKILKNSFLPPFVFEIVLSDGRNFYVQSTLSWDNDEDFVQLRVWDLRTISEADLRAKMNKIDDRSAYSLPSDIDENLDVGTLFVAKEQIKYVIVWHDRYLPSGEHDEETKREVGFYSDSGQGEKGDGTDGR